MNTLLYTCTCALCSYLHQLAVRIPLWVWHSLEITTRYHQHHNTCHDYVNGGNSQHTAQPGGPGMVQAGDEHQDSGLGTYLVLAVPNVLAWSWENRRTADLYETLITQGLCTCTCCTEHVSSRAKPALLSVFGTECCCELAVQDMLMSLLVGWGIQDFSPVHLERNDGICNVQGQSYTYSNGVYS